MSDVNNVPILGMDINKTVQLIQNGGSTVSSASPLKNKAPKKRTRRRCVYSKPKKKKKKKDICENLIDTVSFPTVGLICENKDKGNHSDCSSDTIIDDLNGELYKAGVNIGNEFPNSLPEDGNFPPTELGRLLISDGMLLSETKQSGKRKKGARSKSRARNNKSKGNRSKKIQPEFDNPPLLSIKCELEETSDLPAVPVKESANIISEKMAAFPEDFQNTTHLFSASVDVAVSESKKRKPQTARRGKKKQNSYDRNIIQQPKNNILAFDDYPVKGGSNLFIDQSLMYTKEIPSISNVFESSMTEKMMTAKKRSPAKRNRYNRTSAVSDISNNDVSSFLMPSVSNALEQNNLSCHTINPSLIESKQNSKRKRASPNIKNTSKRNLKSLDSLNADDNANASSFPPVKKKKRSSPRKTDAKKSVNNMQKELDIVERQCTIKSGLVTSIKEELSDTFDSDNFVLKRKKSNTEEVVFLDDSIDKFFSDPNAGNVMPSSKKSVSKTYVSMFFEEDTSVADETDEHISYLLSLGSKKSKNIKDGECFKNPSKISADNSDANLKKTPNDSSSNAIFHPRLQLDNLVENILDKGISESECLLPLNVSRTIGSNIPNIKKEAQDFSNNSVEMCSVDKMSSESVNTSNTVESFKSLASDSLGSNTATQRAIHSESLNIHTSLNSGANAEKLAAPDFIKKEPIDLQENGSPDKSVSKSESLHQLNASHTIDSNIPNIKKEAEHFSNDSVAMCSVDKMSSESVNRSNTMECSKSLASDLLSSNTATQSAIQSESSNIHTSVNSDNSGTNAEKHAAPVIIKKEPIDLQENESPGKSASKSESLHQLNASHTIDSNIPNIKKEAEHFSNDSVAMCSVDKMSSESVNRSNTMECSKSLASDLLSSNTATQSAIQSESSIIRTSVNSDKSGTNAEKLAAPVIIKKEPIDLQENESPILCNIEKLQKKDSEKRAMESLNELAKTYLNHDRSESPILNSRITELSSDGNNSKTRDIAIPQFRTSILGLGQESSESNSRSNSEVLNSATINTESIQGKSCDLPSRISESIQGKTCQLSSVILSYNQIKREPQEVLTDINKTKNSSTLLIQTLHNQGNERNSSGSILEEICLSNESETPSLVLDVDKRPNAENSQRTSRSRNESTFVETRPLPTAYIANATFKSQDNSVIKQKETNELTCNNFLSINIKKEKLEGSILEEVCLSNESETPSLVLDVDKMPNTENSQRTSRSRNESTFVEARPLPTACTANATFKSQDNSVLKQKETNELTCNNFLSINIKKEKLEGSILEEVCLSNESETRSLVLDVDKRPNTENSQHTSRSRNESTFVETRALPTACTANATFKSQDNSVLKQKETNELTCNNFLSINIKKEKLEIKNTSNVNREPSTVSPVSVVEFNENNTSIETLPMSVSINACTIQSLEKNICNDDSAMPSTSKTCSDGCSNYIATPIASFGSEMCNDIGDNVLSHDKKFNTSVTNCISSASENQSSMDIEVGTPSAVATVTSNMPSSINSNQSMVVSDLLMADTKKSFVSSITSVNKRKTADNSSENSCSVIFSSDSDNKSRHSLVDLKEPSRKKIYVNLSTGEIICETNDSESRILTDDSLKNLLDLNTSEFSNRKSLKQYKKCVDTHIARAKTLEKVKNLNLKAVEPEVTAKLNISSDEISFIVSEQDDISNQTSVCDTLSNSRSVTPNNIAVPFQCSSPINLSSPLDEIIENSPDISDSISVEEFDLLANFKKNNLKFSMHPYPGNVPFYKRKPYTGCYFRYDKEISNIPVEDIEKRLKEAEKTEKQAPEDPADGRELDFNSLIPEEIDCYYRVLTAAPSKTLISKYLQESAVSARNCNSLDKVICLSSPSYTEDNASSVSEIPVFADAASARNCNSVDDVMCIFSSCNYNNASSVFEVSTKVSADKSIDQDANESLVTSKNFVTSLSQQDKELGSIFTNDIVFQKETINSLSKNVKNYQQLKPSCSNANVPDVSEINNKLQTDSHENVTKGSESISKVSSMAEQINLLPSVSAVKVSTCTNIFPSNNSKQSNKTVLSNEMPEDTLSRIDDNMLDNEKSNLSTCRQKVLSANPPHEKILLNMTPNNKLISSIDKTDSFISLTSEVESFISKSDSHSGNINDESLKEIPCDSNNPILPMQHCSVINSIHEQSFTEFNVVNSVQQTSSNPNALTSQLSTSFSDHPKLLLIPGISENATSESSMNTQIEEQSSRQLSLQVNELYHSEKDDNSQTTPSLSNTVADSLLSKLNLPTSELRKILETVNILPSPECSEPNLLNFKETYQYDHTRYSYVSPQNVVDYGHGISMSHHGKEYSYYDREPRKIPIVHDYGHKSVKDFDDNLDATNKETVSTTIKARHEVSGNTSICSISDLTSESNEDNYNKNSELSVEASYEQPKESEQKDEMKESAAQYQDAPNVKPQYKSRFQRVMERLSSKKSSKPEPSDLLTECFPVKSSKEKSCIRKPIALVQPCNQESTKNPPKQKKIVPLNNNPLSLRDSKNNKKTKKSKKNKSTSKSKKSTKSPPRNKPIRDLSTLFQPDKIVKAKDKSASKSNSVKSNECPGIRVYGRVTNRGSFLTQSSINQPPKPKEPTGKKSINMMKITKMPTDQLHSMIHSPKIDIIPTRKNIPTCSDELFKSVNRIGGSTSSIASASKTTASAKTSFNSTSSFFKSFLPNPVIRPSLQDPRTILKSVSPDITCKSPNDSSNFLNNPNVHTILPNVPSKKSYLPCNSLQFSNPEIRLENLQAGRRTLLPTPQIGFNKRVTDNEGWFTHSQIHSHAQNYSNPYRSIPVRDFESGVSPLTFDSPSVSGSSINFNVQSSSFTEQSSPSISGDVHISNRSAHHRHSRTRQTKCVCLPPKSLKASVGNAVFDTADVLLLILEWNVDWLVQQQKNHDPPPISTRIRKVVNTYEDFDEYYNTYLPLMLLETWHRIYMSWTSLNQAASPYFCEVTSYSVETHSIRVQCQAIFKSSDAEKGLVPEEGNIIMVKFGTKEKGGIKILGYIRDVKIVPFDSSVSVPFKCLKYTPGENLQMLLLTFSGAYSSDDFDTNQLIRIQILYNIKSTLKQNDALLNLKNSPLYKNILNPLTDGLRIVTLKIRNTDPLKDNASECVRDIIKGILSPHPLPLLTVAKTLLSFDHYLILPSLIEMMKNSYRTKVLLCTRTSKALTDIGITLCGTSIKFVVLGKRSDIHQKLRKYLLEEVANKKLSKQSSEDASINEDTRNSLLANIKLEILKNCDVILSLIRNCHNELVAQACADGDSIARMCCIIDEASACTEPEILIPLLYGISKLILIGDTDVPAKICSKAAANFGYNRSLFHRAYELDLASE
ncbi:Helicase SEN1 like protein [Argiope bruennichi]|uniref:Helicase SEN1 like protein n=1 Tax=Argiope bruennichi TaxID=94029 RepID=A0A8T0F7M8_ARGBR|nr:Helicase SEN1 like protein [Argiope bruennichi]